MTTGPVKFGHEELVSINKSRPQLPRRQGGAYFFEALERLPNCRTLLGCRLRHVANEGLKEPNRVALLGENVSVATPREGNHTNHLYEVFSHKVAQSVDICMERIVQAGRIGVLGDGLVASYADSGDMRLSGIELVRKPEVDVVIPSRVFCSRA